MQHNIEMLHLRIYSKLIHYIICFECCVLKCSNVATFDFLNQSHFQGTRARSLCVCARIRRKFICGKYIFKLQRDTHLNGTVKFPFASPFFVVSKYDLLDFGRFSFVFTSSEEKIQIMTKYSNKSIRVYARTRLTVQYVKTCNKVFSQRTQHTIYTLHT